jgi:DNA-binding CsgD family transcriptional regulator
MSHHPVHPSSNVSPLSPRETEVLAWAACGKTTKATADRLELSDETVLAHIRAVCRKLNATNRTHAVAIALVHGIIRIVVSPELGIPLAALFGLQKMDNRRDIKTSPRSFETRRTQEKSR